MRQISCLVSSAMWRGMTAAIKCKLSLFALICGVATLTQSNIADAVPLTITTDAELVAAYRSLPDAEDNFIKAVESASTTCGSADSLALLFCVLKDAVAQQSGDVDYLMDRLGDVNDIADAMGDYLQDVNHAELLKAFLTLAILELEGPEVDAGFEATGPGLLLALYDSDGDSPISVVGASSDEVGTVNDLMRIYNIPLEFTASIPEPGTLSLFVVGLAGLGFVIRRRRVRQG